MAAKLGDTELNEAYQIHKPYMAETKRIRTLETLPAYFTLAGERLSTYSPRSADVYAVQTYDLQCFFFQEIRENPKSLILQLSPPVFANLFTRFIVQSVGHKSCRAKLCFVLLGFAFFIALAFISCI